MTLVEIGRVKLVQVQRESLKAGERPHSYYDPAPLTAVERLLLAPEGCVGVTSGGEQIVDVHNTRHPGSRNRGGENPISVGFTSHYRAMRDQYGAHLEDGCAGENILVEAERGFALDDLGAALVIRGGDGREAVLSRLIVAAPCVEFSRFAHISADPLTADELRATLQFLDGGRRGFYAQIAGGPAGAAVRVGDRVFVRYG